MKNWQITLLALMAVIITGIILALNVWVEFLPPEQRLAIRLGVALGGGFIGALIAILKVTHENHGNRKSSTRSRKNGDAA